MERISVIVPYYNSNVFLLRKCLLSLAAQTYEDMDALVVVDGSDKDIDRVREYFSQGRGSTGRHIRFADIEHSGVGTARNYGIEHTDGEYIAFVDSDDFVDEFFLEKLYQRIKIADISVCSVAEQPHPTEDACIDTKIFFSLPSMYNKRQYTNFSVNKLYRRDIIEKYNIRFPVDMVLGEDAIFLADYYERINHISAFAEPLYHYVPNTASATMVYKPEYWEWERRVIHRQWELFHKYPLVKREEDYMLSWLCNKFIRLFNYYRLSGDEKYKEHIQDIVQDKLFKELAKGVLKPNEFLTKEMIRKVKKLR